MKKYTYRSVVRRAKKDARDFRWKFWPFIKEQKAREPKTDQEIDSQFEKELFQVTEANIAKFAEEWKRRDEKLKPEYCNALVEFNQAEEHLKELKGDESNSYKEYEIAKIKFEQFEQPSLGGFWVTFWMITIGISEFFINSIVLQVFGYGKIETYIAAGSLCIMIPLLAHFWGQFLNQKNKTRNENVWIIVIPVIMLLILTFISILRSKFFEGLHVTNLLGIDISPALFTMIFFVINVGLFILATILSHEGSHPLHKQYKHAKKRYRNALKEFSKDQDEVKVAAKKADETESNLEKIKHKRAKIHERILEEAKIEKEAGEWLMSAYRAKNLSNRDDVPECFKKPHHEPVIPITLQHIDWNCEEKSGVDKLNISSN